MLKELAFLDYLYDSLTIQVQEPFYFIIKKNEIMNIETNIEGKMCSNKNKNGYNYAQIYRNNEIQNEMGESKMLNKYENENKDAQRRIMRN